MMSVCPEHSTLGDAPCTLELGFRFSFFFTGVIYINFFVNDIYENRRYPHNFQDAFYFFFVFYRDRGMD